MEEQTSLVGFTKPRLPGTRLVSPGRSKYGQPKGKPINGISSRPENKLNEADGPGRPLQYLSGSLVIASWFVAFG